MSKVKPLNANEKATLKIRYLVPDGCNYVCDEPHQIAPYRRLVKRGLIELRDVGDGVLAIELTELGRAKARRMIEQRESAKQ